MAFPATPLDVLAELSVDNVWQDITGYVFDRDSGAISITRGRQNESSQMDPSLANMVLNNKDGRFSPRNPTGIYYGKIGRNTPIRLSVREGSPFLLLPGATDSMAVAPDTPGTSVAGDTDIRIELALNSNNSTSNGNTALALASKYNDVGNQRAWAWWIRSDGVLAFRWSPDGVAQKNATATSYLQLPPERICLRVTMDVDSGGGTSTVTFYKAPTMSGPWSMVGDPVVRSEVTSVFDSTEPINLGVIPHITGIAPMDGRIYRFELRNGVNGTAVANPDFTSQTVGATSFADVAGNTWSLTGSSAISNRNYRFCGEVSSWPQKWDLSGNDVYVPLQASGITRRLGQGSPPVQSALFREFTNPTRTNIVAYWSCEDAPGSTQIGSAFPGHPAGVVSGFPEFAADDTYVASQALPNLNNGRFSFSVPSYPVTGQTSMRVYMALGTIGSGTSTARQFSVKCSGTAAYWELLQGNTSGLTKTLVAKDAGGTVLLSAAVLGNSWDNKALVYELNLTENGSGGVDWQIRHINITDGQRESTPQSIDSGTLAGQTVGSVISISVAPDGNMPSTAVVGHVVLANSTNAYTKTIGAMFAWLDEPAGDRMARLCAEEGVPFVRQGFAQTVPMGPQSAETLLTLIQECVDADQGVLFEPRDRIGLGYISRWDLYNQYPQLSLTYDQEQLIGTLDPIDDDQQTKNDVTVTRKFGTSARAIKEEGPLSVNDPALPGIEGVGRYTVQSTQNLNRDDQLPDAAGWQLLLGTVNESRYPTLGINLAHPVFSGSPELTERGLYAEQGQRIVVSGLPAWLPPDDVSQLVLGYTESMRQFEYTIVFNASPESPYRVGMVNDPVLGHVDTEGSSLSSAATSGATSLSVATTLGPLWTANPADVPFDLMIEGERITVTAVGQVLNTNPSFEVNTSGWSLTNATLTRSNAHAQTGSWSGLLTAGAGAIPRAESTPAGAVTAGQQYRASGWLFAPAAIPAGVSVNVNWYDGSSVYLSTSANTTVPAVGSWFLMDAIFTAPASAAFAGLVFNFEGTPGAGVQLFADDVRLVPTSSYATSPQTFTVTRSINGVVKALASGSDVRLYQPAILAL